MNRSITRRNFLKVSGLAAGTLLAGVPRLPAASTGKKVLVLGAGIAGIGAARELADYGFSVTVLEARKRIGGRMWTDHSLGGPVDLGAAWLEGPRGNPVKALCRRAGVKARRSDYDNTVLYDSDGALLPDNQYDFVEGEYERLIARMGRARYTYRRDVPVSVILEDMIRDRRYSSEQERLVRWGIQEMVNEAAADLDCLSSYWTEQDEEFSGGDFLVHTGYDEVPKALAKGLDVRLDHQVKLVRHGQSGVTVETSKGVLTADAVLITAPVNVLKAGVIKFEPELPDWKLEAIEGLGEGVVNKVVLSFDKPYWPDDVEFFAYVNSRAPGEFPFIMNLYPYTRKPMLVGYVNGRHAEVLEDLPDIESRNRMLAVVRTLFGRSVPDPTGYITSQWGKAYFSKGAYSHIPPGSSFNTIRKLAKPVGNRLFFAGEATHKTYPATVHGAYMSGLREAKRIRKMS